MFDKKHKCIGCEKYKSINKIFYKDDFTCFCKKCYKKVIKESEKIDYVRNTIGYKIENFDYKTLGRIE